MSKIYEDTLQILKAVNDSYSLFVCHLVDFFLGLYTFKLGRHGKS